MSIQSLSAALIGLQVLAVAGLSIVMSFKKFLTLLGGVLGGGAGR